MKQIIFALVMTALAVSANLVFAEAKTASQIAKAEAVVQKVQLNKASLEQLDAIPGLGKKKAQAVLDYIAENGSHFAPAKTRPELWHDDESDDQAFNKRHKSLVKLFSNLMLVHQVTTNFLLKISRATSRIKAGGAASSTKWKPFSPVFSMSSCILSTKILAAIGS